MNFYFLQVKQLRAFDLGHGEVDLHDREVWSHLCQGPADPSEFYAEKCGKFDLPNDE